MTGPASSSRRVCLGVVVDAHGIQGAVRVKSFTADPLDVAAYGPVSSEDGARVWPIRVQGSAKGVVLCRLEGVRDRTTAEALKGQRLWVDRDALPADDPDDADGDDDSYYHADLIGLRVEVENDGRHLGAVRAVHDFGAGDVLDIAPVAGGRPLMVPFTRAAVPLVDLDGGRLVVAPLPGLLDDAAAEDPGHD